MISAILRAQLLSMRSFRLGSSRRGAVFSAITAVIWYGFWTMLAFTAMLFTADPASRALLPRALPAGFLLAFAYWQLAPLVSASMGASLDMRRLLVYPVPHRKLFFIEILLRLATAIEMLLVLTGGSGGLLLNPVYGGIRSAPRILGAVTLFIAFNLGLAAGVRTLIERLLSKRRIREIVVLVLVLVGAAPRLLIALGFPFHRVEHLLSTGQGQVWPWAAAARACLSQQPGIAVGVLATWIVAAYAFGRWQFERSLRFDTQAAQATLVQPPSPRTQGLVERLYRLPSMWLPDPLGAIVEKELRSLSRTPRFRLVFIMGFSFGLMIWLPLILGAGGADKHPQIAQNFLALVSVYALTLLGQVSYWNAFGFDRSSAQVYFSMPVPLSQSLAGKNIAASLFILLELTAVTVACLLLRVRIPAARILEAFLVTPVAALYMLALGNLSSVHYPRALNPERVSQGGASSRFQALIFVLYPVALLPVFLAYVARAVMDSQLVFDVVLGVAALIGVAVYWIAMESAVEAARRRRELILAELSRSEGPVASD